MEISIPTAAIATLLSTILSAMVTIAINRKRDKKNFDNQLDDILKISIQYPYLESEKFTKTWLDHKDDDAEEYLRYDIYCILVFNYLSRLFKFYKYKKEKVDKILVVKDWVRIHKNYWQNPINPYENIDSYDKNFRSIIEEYIR